MSILEFRDDHSSMPDPLLDGVSNERDTETTPVIQRVLEPRHRPRLSPSRQIPPSTVHLRDYLRVLFRRRHVALMVFAVFCVAVTVYSFTATPVYEAVAQLLIENENPSVVTFKEVIATNQATDDYYQTQYRLLQSRALAKRTLNATNLWHHPEFNSLSILSRVKALTPWSGARERASRDESAQQTAAIDGFLDRLRISPVRNSMLVQVAFTATSPDLAARAAHGLTKAFIEQSLELRFNATKEASAFLTQQLSEQRKAVEASELALQRYREQNDALSLEDRQNIVVQRLSDLNAAVTKARTERIQKQALFNQVRDRQPDRAARDSVPAILSNSFIQQLKGELADLHRQQAQLGENLGDRHPDMVKLRSAIQNAEAKLQAEVAKIVEALRSDYLAAVEEERSLSTALEQQKAEALALNHRGIDYGVLQRDAATNRQIFDGLLQRTKETDIAGELRTSNIRIVDVPEVPREPARPNHAVNLLFAIFGGLSLAVGAAFFVEYCDGRIKSPDEITQLGLPYLGLIPSVTQEQLKAANGPLEEARCALAEALRSIRTKVMFSSAEGGGRVIAVTSTAPGEGKTFVSTSLARSLAMAGQRVLIVDADMRRPKVHEQFARTEDPGLSNVLVGRKKIGEAVHRLPDVNLSMLAAGKVPPNPAELLASSRFGELIASLSEHFDWIVIDTPPVMAVTDAAIIAAVAHEVVFVIGADMTSKQAAATALATLDGAHPRYVGAILNRADTDTHGYYYAPYYRPDYTASYGSRSKASA